MTRPNFIIVGAMRSGTTTLFTYLSRHPDVFMPPQKELHYFDVHYGEGIGWYERWFDVGHDVCARGEASQTYMYDPASVERISLDLPSARLIAILRDPVDRAYSHYWMNRSRGREDLSFEEALVAESTRIGRPDGLDKFVYSYADRGRYVVQLERLSVTYPRDRLLVLLFDDLVADPDGTAATLYRFLEVDPFQPLHADRRANAQQAFRSLRARRWAQHLKRRGGAGVAASRMIGRLNRRPFSYPPMDAHVRAELMARFASDNEALAVWLGRDLSGWSGMAPASAAGDRR
jgi:Sulfotransferase domain